GGNYLLNVGPKADGTFPQESIDILKGMGAWMKVNGEAIYDSKASPFGLFPWGRCTKKENGTNTTLYLSVFDWPKDGKLALPGLKNKVSSAKLLANGAILKTRKTKEGLNVLTPEQGVDSIANVNKKKVKGNFDIEKTKPKD